MKKNICKFGSIKHNKVISIHSLGGVSTKPNVQIISESLKISFNKFLKELLKLILFLVLGKKNYFNFIIRFNFEKK